MLNKDGYITSSSELLPQTDPVIEKKIRVLGLSKSVRYLGVLDIIFSIYYAFAVYWPCLFLSFLGWCGYYGAKKFKSPYLIAYMVCIGIYTILKMVLLGYSSTILYGIINTISLIMEIYLGYIVFRFYKDLTDLSDENLEELRNGYEPRVISFIYW